MLTVNVETTNHLLLLGLAFIYSSPIITSNIVIICQAEYLSLSEEVK